ncbi:TPA: conjugal transfer protein TraF [Escherichia coli]
MMKKNHITRTIIASAVLFSFNAAAATSYFEARNDAMGGTGVASSHYGVAPLANPALLTKHNSNDDFSLLLPSVGAQVADPDDVSNKADDVKDDWDLFDSAVDNQDIVDGLMKIYPDPVLNPGAREELNAASSIWLTKAQYQYLLRMENTLQPESRISLLLELVSNAEHHGFMERLVNIP